MRGLCKGKLKRDYSGKPAIWKEKLAMVSKDANSFLKKKGKKESKFVDVVF